MRVSTRTQGAVGLLQIDGVMREADLPAVREAVDTFTDSGRRGLLFDLSAVPAVDSAALELLLDSQDACRRRGAVLKLTGVQPLVQEVLAITNLDRHFEIFPNQLDALGSFST